MLIDHIITASTSHKINDCNVQFSESEQLPLPKNESVIYPMLKHNIPINLTNVVDAPSNTKLRLLRNGCSKVQV